MLIPRDSSKIMSGMNRKNFTEEYSKTIKMQPRLTRRGCIVDHWMQEFGVRLNQRIAAAATAASGNGP